MAKIELKDYYDLSSLRSVENKIIMLKETPLLITGINITEEEETYGRKNNKVRTVKYLNLTVYGYNKNGDFLGTFDEKFITQLILMYDVLKMRKAYVDFKKGWELIHQKEVGLNNPLQTLVNKFLSPEAEKEIKRCISEDRKLLAMKLYKEETGCTLEEAKEYIKSLTI